MSNSESKLKELLDEGFISEHEYQKRLEEVSSQLPSLEVKESKQTEPSTDKEQTKIDQNPFSSNPFSSNPFTFDVSETTFKVVLIGDGGVGKTTFITRHLTGEFEKYYNPTSGVDVRHLQFYTNCGPINFHCWDIAGQEGLRGKLIDGFTINTKAAIIMFDVTSRMSYTNVPRHYTDIIRATLSPEVPIVLCGNKVDRMDRVVKPKQITFHRKKNLQYYDISAKSLFNFEKPFLYLARKLLKQPDLLFVEAPRLAPTFGITEDLLAQYTEELLNVSSLPPPDDDEDDFDF